MIKINKGDVYLSGTGDVLLTELALLIENIAKIPEIPNFFIQDVIDNAFKRAETNNVEKIGSLFFDNDGDIEEDNNT